MAGARGGQLVRDFIREKLCGEAGYFCQAASPVLTSSKTLQFRELVGVADYKRAVAAVYESGDGSDVTLRAGDAQLSAPKFLFL